MDFAEPEGHLSQRTCQKSLTVQLDKIGPWLLVSRRDLGRSRIDGTLDRRGFLKLDVAT